MPLLKLSLNGINYDSSGAEHDDNFLPFPFQSSLLIPPKKLENTRFPDVFRAIKRDFWEEKGLNTEKRFS